MGDFVIQVFWNIYNIWLKPLKTAEIGKEDYFSSLQVYGPCVLLVVISWVSFWLNREATSDRISLSKITDHRQARQYSEMLRYHHGAHHDLHGTGGSEGSSESDLPYSSGLFRIHLFYVHFLYGCSGETRQRLSVTKIFHWNDQTVWPGSSFHQDRLGRILSGGAGKWDL